MKRLFLEAKYTKEIELDKSIISKLPDKLTLASTVQFVESMPKIKKVLEESGKQVKLLKGVHSKHDGQILGCDVINYDINIGSGAILFIGSGKFHPISLAFKYKRRAFVYNPLTKEFGEISELDVKTMEKRKNVAVMKFHAADTVGIIKSLKPGQSLNQAKIANLKTKYPEKEYYEFISDDIDYLQLNNFIFVDCWVNTSCPRISYDDHDKMDEPIIDILDVV